MADPMYEPSSIQVSEGGLKVVWRDGHRTTLPPRYLRGNCGCAHCVDEITHQRRVSDQDVDANVRVEDFMKIGNYAVALMFSDLHATGIYPFTLVRGLCDCAECRALKQGQHQA